MSKIYSPETRWADTHRPFYWRNEYYDVNLQSTQLGTPPVYTTIYDYTVTVQEDSLVKILISAQIGATTTNNSWREGWIEIYDNTNSVVLMYDDYALYTTSTPLRYGGVTPMCVVAQAEGVSIQYLIRMYRYGATHVNHLRSFICIDVCRDIG